MNQVTTQHFYRHAFLLFLLATLVLTTAKGAPSTVHILKLSHTTLTPAGIQLLQLKNRVGTVVFQGSRDQMIQIHAKIKPLNHHGVYFFGLFSCCTQRFQKEIETASLLIKRKKTHTLVISLDLPHDRSLKHIKVDWSIEAPEDLGLKLRNNVGPIDIHDMAGTILVHNNVGSIAIGEARANVNASVNVGTISISGARHSVSAKTNVGSIHVLSAITSIHRINLDTNIGTLHLAGMPVRGGSGSTSTSVPVGGNYRYTGSGRYTIRLKANIGKIDLTLSGSPTKGRNH
ncbi:MAG: DUF4097 family beta strand repeat-containing protein [Gammaproteobacteria bacterium]